MNDKPEFKEWFVYWKMEKHLEAAFQAKEIQEQYKQVRLRSSRVNRC